MITIRPADERGHADHGWLSTYHTFSFDTYHDPKHVRFRSLRVINEDYLQPGRGFGMHPHRDMEIITYVLKGALEHKDNIGNGSVIRPGDVQRMSAGSGITHSEFNHSKDEMVHLLQIWIMPDKKGVTPSYEEKTFPDEDKRGRLRLIASPDGADGSVTINQDARVYATILKGGESVTHNTESDRYVWLQVARGIVKVNGKELIQGDGAAVTEMSEITLVSDDDSEVLLFDLA